MVKDTTATNARSHINISNPLHAFSCRERHLKSRESCCEQKSCLMRWLLSAHQELAKEPGLLEPCDSEERTGQAACSSELFSLL